MINGGYAMEPSGGSVTRPAAVIVLAAGEGTRMKSSTPKVLNEVCGRTMLGHALAAAREVIDQAVAQRLLVGGRVLEVAGELAGGGAQPRFGQVALEGDPISPMAA